MNHFFGGKGHRHDLETLTGMGQRRFDIVFFFKGSLKKCQVTFISLAAMTEHEILYKMRQIMSDCY